MKRMPAEWETQQLVQLTWPHQYGEWKSLLPMADPCFAKIAYEISLRQSVLIVAYDQAHQLWIQELLAEMGANMANVVFAIAPSEDIWARDHAALTVEEAGQKSLVKFAFNGWGNKYKSNLDNDLHWQILQSVQTKALFNKPTLKAEQFVLEGGSIESDGQGTILTTESCLLNPNRNPSLNRLEVEEQILKTYLGAERTLWLKHGHIHGDDTDSHVDTIARFCSPTSIAYVSPIEADEMHRDSLQLMEAELKAFKQKNGQPYELFALPNPQAKYHEGNRLPATYANFLIINQAVLVPLYNDEQDAKALEILQKAFPNHEIVGINCLPLIIQRGSLHCATMQYVGQYAS